MNMASRYRAVGGNLLVAPMMVFCVAGPANAVTVDLGNPDMSLRWDNTVRYNVGFRVNDCDKDICGNDAGAGDVTAYQSDRKFSDAGDVVTNRVDILTEMDFIYKDRHGARLSASGWYDQAYDGDVEGDRALDASGAGNGAGRDGDNYSRYTDRWNNGPSGEILDAFVFTGFDLGSVPVNLKAGQHNVYWGESLFSFVNGVSYQQGPVDIRKALATPGTEAKELFKPLNQISMIAQLQPDLTVAAQYLLDWKPMLVPNGGTYFGAIDGLSLGSGGSVFGLPFEVTDEPDKKHGDWGVSARWSPQWLDGTLGFYYREYTNRFPQLVLTKMVVIPGVGAFPAGAGIDYSSNKREKLYGVSLSKQVWGISWGTDITYREDAVLATTPLSNFVPEGTAPDTWVPRGKLWSGVFNGVAYFSKTPFYDAASLTAELNYSYLDEVTENAQTYNGKGYNCADDHNATKIACQTRDALGASLMFRPTWYQVMPGIDLSMPLFVDIGLHGNSPVMFGSNEGQGIWSMGVSADIYAQYSVDLKYNGFISKHSDDELGAGSLNNSSLGKYWDRDWVSLTFKTTF
ncbi:Protein of unknown function [Pseudomonas sp. NFACC07-1]|uniref:DUF1302 domain-containing protein n=2 Tax=unclassified Pseudomonas TaxID=196821 RepID=UPI0008CC5B53|nr:DUF1302 family protein [Pseudomonas sp. NFACC46-3]SEI49187.1 Protein of unknown function [Pseudomonas sp. NFACC07-1]SFL06781.1 Protein of unknown function [Pseudomonas sp. NFACC46-3]